MNTKGDTLFARIAWAFFIAAIAVGVIWITSP